MKRQRDMMPEDGSPRWECDQYATGEEQREVTKSFRKNEAAGPEWERPSAGDAENIMRNAGLDESQAGIEIYQDKYQQPQIWRLYHSNGRK